MSKEIKEILKKDFFEDDKICDDVRNLIIDFTYDKIELSNYYSKIQNEKMFRNGEKFICVYFSTIYFLFFTSFIYFYIQN